MGSVGYAQDLDEGEDEPVNEIVVPLITLLIGGGLTYAGIRYQGRSTVDAAKATASAGITKMSGDVNTSEAETLWAESASMRRELREELTSMKAEMVGIQASHIAMQAEVAVTKEELSVVRTHAARCDEALEGLQQEMADLVKRESARDGRVAPDGGT